MRPLPEIMQHPDALSTAGFYRSECLELFSRLSLAARQVDASSAQSTTLAISLGALDAGICSLIAFHISDGSAFDAGQFLEMVGQRLEHCLAVVERVNAPGGIQ